MFGLGIGELLVIFVFALIFIGPKKLPELAKSLGKGLREFQNATKGFSEQLDQAKREITREIDDAGLKPSDFPLHPHHDATAPSEPTPEIAQHTPQQETEKKDS